MIVMAFTAKHAITEKKNKGYINIHRRNTFVYLYETFDDLRQQLTIFCFMVSLQIKN